ncbi:MAG: ABC transporter permease [Candidatus Azobacteroides sp.]|nr:ABC transporter permease [Candidatus Azobacteroides sp.]
MNLSLYIAKRYLFSKKSHNAINIISMVAVCGVAIATMATVCTLSVFNGFEVLISNMFSSFDPELKITPAKGKVFDPSTTLFAPVYSLPEIDVISKSLEDNVLLKYGERQTPAIMKGVSDNFGKLAPMNEILFDGEFRINEDSASEEDFVYANLGIGIASRLGMNSNFASALEIYVPKRNAQVNLSNPISSFNLGDAYISSVFVVNQPVYDDNYLLVSLNFARRLLDYQNEVSALEIKVKEGADIRTVQKKIRQIVGDDFLVKDRYQQQEAAFKMVSVEKWVTFLMLCFILLIAVFNIIGSLSMLMVDKQKDIFTLRNLGAGNRLISRIFLFEGWLILSLGAIVGIVLGVLICLGQHYFGWLQLGTQGAFAVNAYPVRIEIGDIAMLLLVVLTIGFSSVTYPVRYLSQKWLK